MNFFRSRGGATAAAALTATIILIGRPALRAQDQSAEKAPETVLSAALSKTKAEGAATVAVFTAADQPTSLGFWTELNDGAWARANRGLVQLVNVAKDANPELVGTMGVTRYPTVVVFARGPQGVVKLGSITDCDSPERLVQWLRALQLDRPGPSDLSVTPTMFGGDVHPSLQAQAPPPPTTQSPPPLQAQPPPPPTQMLMAAPQQVSAAASVIQVPSQNLMIQQAPPQVFLAPQSSPVVYVPQMMSVAPAAPPAPAANLFMSAPSVAAAPPAAPTLAVAAAPAAAPATLAVAAGPPTLAVNNQTLSLASTASRSRVRVRGPGLLNSSLARFGERLTRLGRTRIESVQETTLEAPLSQAPPGGLTTISTTSAAPVIPQQPPTVIMEAPEEVCEHKCKRPCRHRGHAPCQHDRQPPCPPQGPGQGPPPGPPRLMPTPQDGSDKS